MQKHSSHDALKDQSVNGNELHLFETMRKGKPCRYAGEFVCVTWEPCQWSEVGGSIRSAVIFQLLPIEGLTMPQTAKTVFGQGIGPNEEQSPVSGFSSAFTGIFSTCHGLSAQQGGEGLCSGPCRRCL